MCRLIRCDKYKLISWFIVDSLGLDSLDTLDDEYSEEQSLKTEDNSVSDDDDEFARKMTHVQGAFIYSLCY